MDLNPTPTRRQLLRDVDEGFVHYTRGIGPGPGESTLRIPIRKWLNVTARCLEAERAGWIRRDRASYHGSRTVRWELTDKGRQILAAHPAGHRTGTP